jgi:hypothetical protein
MPLLNVQRTKIDEHGLADAGPRGAARGGVNLAALPRERGRESPLWIDKLESSNRAGD